MALPLELLLGWCHPAFGHLRSPLLSGPALDKALRLAEKNKLSYLFCLRAKDGLDPVPAPCQEVLRQGEENLRQQRLTLEFVKATLGDIPIMVIKSDKGVPYITWDVDILVPAPAFPEAVARLLAAGASHLRNPGLPRALEARLVRPRGAVLRKEGLVEIDLYQDTSWSGWICLDNAFLWRSPVSREVAGISCLVPNAEADLMLSLAHVLFNHGEMHLLDFIYLNDLRQQVDERSLAVVASQYGWGHAYRALLSIMDRTWEALLAPRRRHPPRFPLLFPVGLILRSYLAMARSPASQIPGASSWNTRINSLIKLATMMVYRGR